MRLVFVSPFTWLSKSGATLLVNWSTSRSFRSFLAGMPAFLLALLLMGLTIYGALNSEAVAIRYNKDFIFARDAAQSDTSKYEHAELLLNRLLRLSPKDREENQLKKAELLLDQKKFAAAAEILQQMVRPSDVGNARAHILLGQYYLMDDFRKRQGFENMPPKEQLRFVQQAVDLAEQHFERALDSSPSPEVADAGYRLLYQVYSRRGEYGKMGPVLQKLVERDPGYGFAHYEYYTKRVNLPATAEQQATRSHIRLKEMLQKNPRNMAAWQALVRLLLVQRKFEEAVSAFNLLGPGFEGLSNEKERNFIRRLMADIMYENAMYLAQSKGEAETRLSRLALLSNAVRLAPSHRQSVEQLVVLGFPLQADDSEQWLLDAKANAPSGSPLYYGVNLLLGLRALFNQDMEKSKMHLELASGLGPGFGSMLGALTLAIDQDAKSMLEKLEGVNLNEETGRDLSAAPALFGIYMILGSKSVVEKQYDRGLDFFQRAAQANPNSTTAINNVAYCMVNRDGATPKDFEDALLMATRIIEAAPQIPNFYETRGAIHMKMENYSAAVMDFERALAFGFQNREMVHQNLVKALRALGRDDEANSYAKLVDDAETKAPLLPTSDPSDPSDPSG